MLDSRRSNRFLMIGVLTVLVGLGLSAIVPADEGEALPEPPVCAPLAAYAANLVAIRSEAFVGGGTRQELLAAHRALADCIEAHGVQRSTP